MAKPFNKLLKDFFRLQQTAEHIDVLHNSLKMSRWENFPIGQIRDPGGEWHAVTERGGMIEL